METPSRLVLMVNQFASPFEVGRGCLTNIVSIPFTLIKGGFAFDEYLHTSVFTQFLGALLLRRLAKNEKKRTFLKFFS